MEEALDFYPGYRSNPSGSELPSSSNQHGAAHPHAWRPHARSAVMYSDPGYTGQTQVYAYQPMYSTHPGSWQPGAAGSPVMYAPYTIVAAPPQMFYAVPGPGHPTAHVPAYPAYWVPFPCGPPQPYWHQPPTLEPQPPAAQRVAWQHSRQPLRGMPHSRHRPDAPDVVEEATPDAGAIVQTRQQRAAGASSSGGSSVIAASQPACPPEPQGWGSLTAGILQHMVAKLGEGEVKHMRMVCQHWRCVVDNNLESLSPSELQTRVLVRRFRNLKVLHLTSCANVRNRDLLILANSGLALHTLTLGDDANKHWVTNEGLAAIARMPSLTSLNLHDCNGVTNNGLLALTKLQQLSTLSLKGCCKLTSGALEAIQGHSSLTSLNLYGCRVTDEALLALQHLQLVSLHLGNTRVRDEGLGHLARITTLQELHFDQEQLSDAGVSQLTSLTRLKSLALRNCANVTADSLGVLIPALPLISLDLYKNFSIDDLQLSRCLEFLGAVTFLDLRCTPVTDDGLQQLTKLSSLQKLCLTPTQERLWSPYLCVVSNLTQLISLSINNCTLQFRQLDTLRQLKLLRELDLSHDSSKEELQEELAGQPSVNPTAIDAMANITSLTSIDLSRRQMHEQHLSTLAERLPRLHTLIIIGCPVLKAEVQSLKRRFPDLSIHHRPQLDVSCSASDHSIG